ncbi:DUF2779 domain-containing protein [Nanoarchaeota archaeon]
MSPKILSKSKYLYGLQCSKYLWVSINDKGRLSGIDEQTQFRFDEGHKVGELAKSLFSEGIEIGGPYWETKESDERSKKALAERKPLFEAGFLFERLYSRADVLLPVGKDEWDIIEVKSSTSVKDVNIFDVAFQRYCYEQSGLKIRKCFLMHLNNKYVRKGEVNNKELFTKTEITDLVNEEIKNVPKRAKEMLKIIDSKIEPKIDIGEFCKKPYSCSLMEECWKGLPEENVFDLYRGGKKAFELYDKGIRLIREIPEDFKLNDKQMIQKTCSLKKKVHVNKEAISSFIKKLEYPLYFLDFETYSTAIPLYDGLKPYQQIPFQFSLHVVDKEGKTKHYSFIAEGSKDPRKAFVEELKKVLGTKGDIIVYNQGFEQARIKELAELFPEYQKWAISTIKRMVDLLIPFRNFDYYNCKQQGSASLKAVLPAVTGKTYEGMEIAEGGLASLRYLYIIHGDSKEKKASEEEIKKVRKDLEEYCALDTEAMIWILDELRYMIK